MHYAAVVVRRARERLRTDHLREALHRLAVPSLRTDPTARVLALFHSLLALAAMLGRPLAVAANELFGGSPRRSWRPAHPSRVQARRLDPEAAHLRTAQLAAAFRARARGIPRERFLPAGVAALLLVAAVVSALPAASPGTTIAGVRGTPATRIVIQGLADRGYTGPDAPAASAAPVDRGSASDPSQYLDDGTLVNTPPVIPTTAAPSLLQTYVVQSGDTAIGIAHKFGISLKTLYWANQAKLPDPASMYPGLELVIPPVDGLVVTVGDNDTLESLALQYGVSTQDIVEANGLPSPLLVVGQTLIIPGASGAPLPTTAPTAKPTPKPAPRTTTKTTRPTTTQPSSGGTYSGGALGWPVGGHNYISQGFWSGHRAIDIAAPYGTAVYAAAGGTVVYAGWKSYTGGGNIIWLSNGGGIYTTYNHLSAWSVSVGQHVSRGQRIGSIGTSGIATGPHLHFEVWLSYPWSKHNNYDAVNPCRYLSRC